MVEVVHGIGCCFGTGGVNDAGPVSVGIVVVRDRASARQGNLCELARQVVGIRRHVVRIDRST